MAVKISGQTALDERILEDRPLELALEKREKAKAGKAEAAAAFKTKDEVVQARLEELGLAAGEIVRVGPYRISKSAVEARSVEFETDPTTRLSIKRDEG